MLESYVTGAKGEPAAQGETRVPAKSTRLEDEPADGVDLSALVAKHEHAKPSDAALLLAAYHFSLYGAAPFTIDEMRELASDAGLTVPERLDMTLKQFKREKKALFKNAGNGRWRPTVTGEAYLKKAYGVFKGKGKKASGNAE